MSQPTSNTDLRVSQDQHIQDEDLGSCEDSSTQEEELGVHRTQSTQDVDLGVSQVQPTPNTYLGISQDQSIQDADLGICQESRLLALPDEILVDIIYRAVHVRLPRQHFDEPWKKFALDRRLLLDLCLTCRKLQRLTGPCLYEHIFSETFRLSPVSAEVTDFELLNGTLDQHPYLANFCRKLWVGGTDNVWNTAAVLMTDNIREFRYEAMNHWAATFQGISLHVAEQIMPNLEVLSWCPPGGANLQEIANLNLARLHTLSCTGRTRERFERVPLVVPNGRKGKSPLKVLAIHDTRSFHPEDIQEFLTIPSALEEFHMLGIQEDRYPYTSMYNIKNVHRILKTHKSALRYLTIETVSSSDRFRLATEFEDHQVLDLTDFELESIAMQLGHHMSLAPARIIAHWVCGPKTSSVTITWKHDGPDERPNLYSYFVAKTERWSFVEQFAMYAHKQWSCMREIRVQWDAREFRRALDSLKARFEKNMPDAKLGQFLTRRNYWEELKELKVRLADLGIEFGHDFPSMDLQMAFDRYMA